jgi:hypothetical protein
MLHKRFFLGVMIIISLLFSSVVIVARATPLLPQPNQAVLASWWDPIYHYSSPLTITNTSGTFSLPTKYSIRFILDTTALISTNRMRSDCADLRIAYEPVSTPTEIDRVVENCNSSQTIVWFALQRPVVASGTDLAYTLYYGNTAASAPPANGMNVFIFFEDWEQGAAHWTNAGGLDTGNTGTMGTGTVSGAAALSPSNSQYFVNRLSGGDAWSGFIPVSPSTSYAFSVWAHTTSSNVCAAVGTYNYTTAYVRGAVNLWADNWPTPSSWSWRTSTFTTASDTAFIKIWDEIWASCSGSPAYVDNIALRYTIGSEPNLVVGDEITNLAAPVISNVSEPGTIPLGNSITVSADISIAAGTVTNAYLQIISPETSEIPMILGPGDNTNGTWSASFLPNQGGTYTYRVRAESSTGLTSFSPQYTFTVNDTTPPVISLFSIINPIPVKNTQTLVVIVTDNGVLSSVTVTVEGATHAMAAGVNHQYSYFWNVNAAGTIPYTVTATDTSNTVATFNGSFVSQPRQVDVCTWKDCRQGAASWSKDDGNNNCLSDLDAAGIKGTFYYNGSSSLSWFTTYSGLGHEIASHTVGHPCDIPGCSPYCTEEALAALPVNQTVVSDYSQNQIEPNIAMIEAATSKPVISLAWPCGCTDPSRWTAAQNYVLGARGYTWYLKGDTWVEAVNPPTPDNLLNLFTAAAYRQDFVDQAYTEGTWSITTAHGECTGIGYIGEQSANGHLWVAPVGEVLKYIYVRDATQLTNYSRDDVARTISFDAAHNLSTFQPVSVPGSPYSFMPILFDNPVTLKVHIQDTDTVLNVTVGGNVVPHTIRTIEGVKYVTFDATLNTSRLVHVNLAAPAPALSDVLDNPDPVEVGSPIQVTASVIPGVGTTLSSVTLQVTAPESHDYAMSLVSGNQYRVSFTPTLVGTYSYQVIATNSEGTSTQIPGTFLVRDTIPPESRNQAQSLDAISVGGTNILSAEGRDLGNLAKVVLSTDESGTWHDFDWSIADWWNRDWAYRKTVTVINNTTNARPYHLVDLLVQQSAFSGLTSCNDLRVVDSAQVEQPVQIYGTFPDCHLLFQANVPASGSSTYHIYYGNSTPPAPSYTTDLTAVNNASVVTIQNTYLDLDLDANSDAGIISRMRLRQGSNSNLPLSTEANAYWGWHQVCSNPGGNITGKNTGGCIGGNAQATGLTMVETLSGPLVREYTFTSVKAASTYTIKYRFFANSPYYQYSLTQTGTAAVMNNFWYMLGNYTHLGAGTDGGIPYPSYNTYSNGIDHFRIVSQAAVDATSVAGTDNDGTDLGGTKYDVPTAQSLSLNIGSGTSDGAAATVLTEMIDPLDASVSGTADTRPGTTYGSPVNPAPGTDWTPISFTWQNPVIVNQNVSWRIKYCDVSGNCSDTPTMSFQVNSPGVPILPSSFYGQIHFNENPPTGGETIEAWVDGMSGPAATTTVLAGNPPYYTSFDVPGDDPGTPQIEGGVENGTVTFKIGGWTVATAPWHSGTHTQVDINSFALHLQPGWNLVSFNLHPADTAPVAVLSSIADSYDLVYAWEAVTQSWLSYDNHPQTTDTLLVMDEETGFWIHVTSLAPVPLYVSGSIPTTTSIDLFANAGGWNLVGFPSASGKALPDVLRDNGVGTNYSLVYAYHASDADPWLMFDRLAPLWVNDLSGLAPSWGYWVQATASTTWSVSYP